MRRVERHQVKEVNSLWLWYKTVNPLKVVINFTVIYIARFVPHLPLKNTLYRFLGMKIGKFQWVLWLCLIYFPELIEIRIIQLLGIILQY